MDRMRRIEVWLIVCLVVVGVAFGLALRRAALFTSDWLDSRLAQRMAYSAGVKAGSLSLWNPLEYGGYPLLATGTVAALYPPNLILHALLPVNIALYALVLLHLLWAAAGTYLLVQRWSASPALAAAAAVAFALGGLLFSPVAELNGWMAAAWLPWLLLLTDRLLDDASHAPREAGLKALALGMALLAGGLALLPGLLLSAAYALYLLLARRPRLIRAIWMVVAVGLGVLLYLPQFLPSREWTAWSVSAKADPGLLGALSQPQLWLPGVVLLVVVLVARGLELFASRGKGKNLSAVMALVLIASLLGVYIAGLPPAQRIESTRPRSADFLLSRTGIYRLYTQDRASAVPTARAESLMGGLGSAYGLPIANGGGAAIPRLYASYASEITPNTLNLMGVKYYLIPQPHGEGGLDYDLNDPFVFNPMDGVSPTPIVMCHSVEIEWYLSDSADLTNGDPVAMMTIVPEEMDEAMDFNLSVGSHVADWAYDRSDVKATVRHSQAVVARTFPARSGNPPEDHTGYVYKAKITLPYDILTQGLWFIARTDPTRIHIERVVMTDQTGTRHVLSRLESKSDHVLAYRTEDVAIFENYDVLPRAFLAYSARAVAEENEALAILRSRDFNPAQEVLLASAEVQPVTPPTQGAESVSFRSYAQEKVILDVTAPAAGYLVLTDAWYPGWRVSVDGRPSQLQRADMMFRAVYLEPGQHSVEFLYQPASFRTGLFAAAAALLATLGLILLDRRQRQPTTTH